jgi:predicted metal-dependent peptidase
MKEEKSDIPAEALGKALQWACSPRGGNNFYGRVLNGCARRDVPGLNTVGVTIDEIGRYVFLWDPTWFAAQDESLQLIVIVHEAAHIVLRHVERGIQILSGWDAPIQARLKAIFQVAGDMACNDTALRPMIGNQKLRFHEHKEKMHWPEKMNFKNGLSMEDYFLLILQELKKNGWDPDPKKSQCNGSGSEPGSGSGTPNPQSQPVPDSGSGDSNPKDKEPQETKNGSGGGKEEKPERPNPHGYPQWFQDMLQDKPEFVDWMGPFTKANPGQISRALRRAEREVRQIVRTAVRQTEKSQGLIPANMKSVLEELLTEPTIPWATVLFGLVKHEISSKLDESTSYPAIGLLHSDDFEPYPGYQNSFKFTIVAAFDTSGSMDDSEVAEAYSELRGVLATEDGVDVRLVHFDAALQYEELLDEDSLPHFEKLTVRHGRGGTNFGPPLRYILHEDEESDWVSGAPRIQEPLGVVDMVLLFTDGGASIPFPELEPDIPFWWVITTRGQAKPKMKNVLHITK